MLNAIDTLKATAVTAQAGMGVVNVIEDPRIQNAIIQVVILILTAILGNIGKKRKSKNEEK